MDAIRFTLAGCPACSDPLIGAGLAEAVAPPVDSTRVTDVTAPSATMHALVNPGGLAATHRFGYLTEAANLAAGEDVSGADVTPPDGSRRPGEGGHVPRSEGHERE